MHIITPYDPWAPKKKKTWQEQMWEEQQIAELEAKVLAEAQSRTLPDNSPAISVATAGPAVNAAAGGGGVPPVQYYHPRTGAVNFETKAPSGQAPLSVAFINTSDPDALQFNTWIWNFNDGTAASTELAPTHAFLQTGSYTVSLTGSNTSGVTASVTRLTYVSASLPDMPLGANWAQSSISGNVPFSVQFTNTTPNYSSTYTNTYKWIFSGSTVPVTPVTTSTETNPNIQFLNAGLYNLKLEVTGSWDTSGSKYVILGVSGAL